MRTRALVIGLILAGLLGFGTSTASAQATRTWVSGVGDDANPCSRTAPCKTFAGRHLEDRGRGRDQRPRSGWLRRGDHHEVDQHHCRPRRRRACWYRGPMGSSSTPLTTDKVLLEGLDIEGLGTSPNGVQIIGSGTTTIRHSSIRHFTGNGVNLIGSTAGRAVIEDCVITNNGGGFNVQGSGVANIGIALRAIFDNNTSFSTQVSSPSSLILSGSTLIGSAVAINATGGATVTSYGNNVIRGSGLPTQTLGLQ